MAQMTEIGLEAHMKKLEISRCHIYVEKGEEGEKEVEKCTTEFVEKEYTDYQLFRRGLKTL